MLCFLKNVRFIICMNATSYYYTLILLLYNIMNALYYKGHKCTDFREIFLSEHMVL